MPDAWIKGWVIPSLCWQHTACNKVFVSFLHNFHTLTLHQHCALLRKLLCGSHKPTCACEKKIHLNSLVALLQKTLILIVSECAEDWYLSRRLGIQLILTLECYQHLMFLDNFFLCQSLDSTHVIGLRTHFLPKEWKIWYYHTYQSFSKGGIKNCAWRKSIPMTCMKQDGEIV